MGTVEPDFKLLSNTELVERIRLKQYQAGNEFYRRFERNLTYLIARMGGTSDSVEDCVHDTIWAAISQIQSGKGPDNPECLAGWIRIIARRTTLKAIIPDRRMTSLDQSISVSSNTGTHCEIAVRETLYSRELNPEQSLLAKDNAKIMLEALKTMRPDYVEILTRFYLKDQSEEQIRLEMGLTATQFRLGKCRAKKILTAAVKKKIAGYSRARLQLQAA